MKAYIFDQDGTLYQQDSDLARALTWRTRSWLASALGLTDEQVHRFYDYLAGAFPNPFEGLAHVGLSVGEYHSNVFDSIEPSEYVAFDVRLHTALAKAAVPKLVVTFASRAYSTKLLRALGILECFDSVLPVSDLLPHTCKSHAYAKIARDLALQPPKICVIGNNFETDIRPAVRAGFAALEISTMDHGVSRIADIHEWRHEAAHEQL